MTRLISANQKEEFLYARWFRSALLSQMDKGTSTTRRSHSLVFARSPYININPISHMTKIIPHNEIPLDMRGVIIVNVLLMTPRGQGLSRPEDYWY